MTTLLVKHTLQMEKLRPKKGSLPKGPSELLLDCRLKPTLTSERVERIQGGVFPCRHVVPPGLGKKERLPELVGCELGT